MCKNWEKSFINFYNDMCTYKIPDDYTLDRIDTNKGYSKENCRWVSRTIQVLNRNILTNSKTRITGVSLYKGAYRSYISVNNKLKFIYYGQDFFEACCARKSAENKIYTPIISERLPKILLNKTNTKKIIKKNIRKHKQKTNLYQVKLTIDNDIYNILFNKVVSSGISKSELIRRLLTKVII